MRLNSAPPFEFFPQEQEYTYAVACLRMVANAYGIRMTEAELIPLCRTTADGTHRDDLVAAARTLGFEVRSGKLTLDDLRAAGYPIVYFDRTPIDNTAAIHSAVVLSVSETVRLADPKFGEREIDLAAFERAWRLCGNFGLMLTKP